MPELDSNDQLSTITHEEIEAAARKAAELGFSVYRPDEEHPADQLRPIREMELQQVLEVVYDQRLNGATHSIQAEIDALEARRASIEVDIAELEGEREELETSRRIRGAWSQLLPLIKDTEWYRAAIATRTLDEYID